MPDRAMDSPEPVPKCSFLGIPQEIRDQIIGELFFPGEREPESLEQNHYGLAPTASRQIWPYDRDAHKKPKFDVSIIRSCHQLQYEAELILYGTSSFNLMYQDVRMLSKMNKRGKSACQYDLILLHLARRHYIPNSSPIAPRPHTKLL